MPATVLKDYYKTLELPPAATPQEIKKAYRALAFKYHPDTNPDNIYAAAHFREIQEAYQVLSHEERRRKYDEERWLNGMGNRAKEQVVITPDWIHKEALRLQRHMQTVDTYRMSHNALHDYIYLLLSDSHMAILQQTNHAETNADIVTLLLDSSRHLKHNYMLPVGNRLAQLVPQDETLLRAIQAQVQKSYRHAWWERYMPAFIVLITLLLCLLMYWWVK